jgi:outer membrane biosynthesis protein TonB
LDRDLRRSAYLSGFIHVALIVAAIITLPITPLPTSSDADVDVDIIGLAPQKSPLKGTQGATAKDVLHKTDAQSVNAPKPKTIEAPPPPPPPPPSSKAPVSTTQTAQTAPPPPPKPSDAPSTVPPPPPVPPQKVTSTSPAKEKPLAKPPTSVKSVTHQQHDVKAPVPLSQSVLNTLLNLKAQQKQTQPPKAVYNPDQNSAPDAGGSPNSTSNSGLTGPDRAAIGNHVRPCWNIDGEAQNVGSFAVLLQVTTDAGGTVRVAEVSPNNTGDMSNPLYFAFTQRALAAVLNAQCATLPLPPNMLGSNQSFTFIFSP